MSCRFSHAAALATAIVFALVPMDRGFAAARGGTLTLTVVDPDTGQPIPCRIHLKNAAGVAQQVPNLPFWKDHFDMPGKVTLNLPRGQYTLEIERGPEYKTRNKNFSIEDGAKHNKIINLKRAVNMAEKGWWSGDLHVHRPLDEIELLMKAEDLHIAPVITWWNNRKGYRGDQPAEPRIVRVDGDRYYHIAAGEDERGGGALLFFNLDQPLAIAGSEREYPSSMKFLLEAAADPNAWIEAEKPFWWDFPVWLASGHVDSIGLANNHLQRSGMLANEAWGKPRDPVRYPAPRGNGQWSQEIYHHVLNCGLRIPPSAGSASGVLANPVGYNRVYVWVDKDEFNYDTWWEGFRAGRVFVTNGPLIQPRANGRLPGHVFQASAGETLEFDVLMDMTWRQSDPIRYVELIQNGQVVKNVSLEAWKKTGHFPPIQFTESGWFLVRVVTEVPNTYRFASSGPWYVEIGDHPRRVSRKSAQFFLDWVNERISGLEMADDAKRADVLSYFEKARSFWADLVRDANAE